MRGALEELDASRPWLVDATRKLSQILLSIITIEGLPARSNETCLARARRACDPPVCKPWNTHTRVVASLFSIEYIHSVTTESTCHVILQDRSAPLNDDGAPTSMQGRFFQKAYTYTVPHDRSTSVCTLARSPRRAQHEDLTFICL